MAAGSNWATRPPRGHWCAGPTRSFTRPSSGRGRATAGRGSHGDADVFFGVNLTGSLRLFQAAFEAGVPRFVFISTCAVHDVILDDRPLDETHPLWPTSHYGAHKAALEAFVHSYGLGQGWPICALRPTGIYGLAHPPQASRWFDLVGQVLRGERGRVRARAARRFTPPTWPAPSSCS